MPSSPLDISPHDISHFCERYHIRRLALFGSVLRQDFAQESDVDVLAEFKSGYVPGLAFFAMQDELSELFGRQVDLNTPQCLSKYFRDDVLAQAKDLYVAHDDSVRLRHMLDACREAEQFSQGRSRSDLDSDRIFQLAMVRLVEIIGQAAFRLSKETHARYANVPWPQIISTGQVLKRLLH